MNAKTDNVYTVGVVEGLVTVYTAADTADARNAVVEEYATKLGKSPASVRAKLVRENVYVKKVATNKNGGEIMTKDKMVAALETRLGREIGDLDSLEKVTKNVLKILAQGYDDAEDGNLPE